jgi:hypothetical protein
MMMAMTRKAIRVVCRRHPRPMRVEHRAVTEKGSVSERQSGQTPSLPMNPQRRRHATPCIAFRLVSIRPKRRRNRKRHESENGDSRRMFRPQTPADARCIIFRTAFSAIAPMPNLCSKNCRRQESRHILPKSRKGQRASPKNKIFPNGLHLSPFLCIMAKTPPIGSRKTTPRLVFAGVPLRRGRHIPDEDSVRRPFHRSTMIFTEPRSVLSGMTPRRILCRLRQTTKAGRFS